MQRRKENNHLLTDFSSFVRQAFHAFVRVRSSATLNLSWAGPGDLVIKRYFESGSESRQALLIGLDCPDRFRLP